MSIRLHVIGAYGASQEEFQLALGAAGCAAGESKPGRFRFGASGNWQWAQASVWHVNGSDIDEALATLSVPGMRVTSSDAILWMLALTGKTQEPFRGVHYFTQVGVPDQPDSDEEEQNEFDEDFPDDELDEVAGINRYVTELEFLWDEEEAARLSKQYAEEEASSNPALESYTEYGASLPQDVVQLMAQQSEDRASRTAFISHSTQIVDSLTRCGIEFNRPAMLNLLTNGPLTELEQDSDLGNMPRFLTMLGISGVFSDESEEDEALIGAEDDEDGSDDNEARDWSENGPGDLFEKVTPITDACSLTDIADGPVLLTLIQVAQLHLLSHLCGNDDQPVEILLRFTNEDAIPAEAWRDLDDVEASHAGRTWRLCFETHHWWYMPEEQSEFDEHELVECLRSLPDGTRVELSFLVDGPSEKCHRYAGAVRDGAFVLEKAYPIVTAGLLNEAIATVNLVIGPKAIALESAEEEAAARAAYKRNTGEVPRIRNGKIKPEGGRTQVVQALFFERFRDRGPWDIQGAERQVAAGWQRYEQLLHGDDDEDDEEDGDEEVASDVNEAIQKMAEMMQQMEDAKAVPHSGEVIFKGRSGRFYRASMTDLKHVSAESLAADDSAMAAIGFTAITDMVGDADQCQELARCYAGPTSAIALLGHRAAENTSAWYDEGNSSTLLDFAGGLREFHTHFEDGSTLVTNDNYGATSVPELGIYVRTYEDFTVSELWQKHLDGIARFREHRNTAPIDHSDCTAPARYAALVDSLLQRYKSSSKFTGND